MCKAPRNKRLDLSWDVCVTVVMFTYSLSMYIPKEVPKSFCQTLIGKKKKKKPHRDREFVNSEAIA